MRKIFPSLTGNDRLRHAFSGSLSHAYIIEGALGSGRLTAARNAAAAALCENRNDDSLSLPCGKCRACSRIFRGIHPDVTELTTASKKSIGVDAARELRSRLYVSPVESEVKFYIIRDAELMTAEAQNSLLISIEEPPPFVVFILLVSDRSALLETIRSRCVILTTEKLDPETVAEAVRTYPEWERLYLRDRAAFDEAVRGSDGAIGKALELLRGGRSDGEALLRDLASRLVGTVLGTSPAERVRLSAEFPRSREQCARIFTLAQTAVRDIISVKLKTDAPLLYFEDPADPSGYAAVPLRRLITLYSALEDGRVSLDANASVSLTTEQLIMLRP